MPAMVSQFRIAGELWAVPMGLRTYAYIYNPDIFEAGGQTPPTTWEEEIPVAEALTEIAADGTMLVAGEGVYPKDEGFTQWQLRCHQAGGSWISEDLRTMTWTDPGCVEAFTFMTSKMTEHNIFIDGFYENWSTAHAEGVVAGFFQPSGALGALVGLDTPWATAPMTRGPANGDTLGNFWPLVMTQQAQGEKYDAAVAFLQYAATPDAVRLWSRITYDVPSLTAVAQEDEFWNSQYSAYVQSLDSAVFIFDPASLEVRTGWEQAWDKVVLEGADPEAALAEGMPNAQGILDDIWEKLDAQGQ
jgi:ABC-type glycerol-3-phosphate transport system substrate-binding protein